jgi:hypothetical protein
MEEKKGSHQSNMKPLVLKQISDTYTYDPSSSTKLVESFILFSHRKIFCLPNKPTMHRAKLANNHAKFYSFKFEEMCNSLRNPPVQPD